MRQVVGKKRSVQTRRFAALVSEWDQLSRSRTYRQQLRIWRGLEPALGSCWDGSDVVHLGLSPDQGESCRVLESLARLAQSEHQDNRVDSVLAARSALQILLPRLHRLCDRGNGWVDFDELVAAVLAFAWEVLLSLPPGVRRTTHGRRTKIACSTPYDFRLWSTIKGRLHTTIEAHIRCCQQDVVVDGLDGLVVSCDAPSLSAEMLSLWVSQVASMSKTSAELVVLSRVGDATVEQMAAPDSYLSALKRRKRSEAKLKAALLAA